MIDLPSQSAVLVRWTFIACVVVVFALLVALAVFMPQHMRAGLIAARVLFLGQR
jgi:hypothetical protein